MALPDGQHRNLTKDGSRRAQPVHGSPVPLRDVTLPGGGDRSLTPPVPSGTSIPSTRSESVPSPYPSGSNSSLSASATTLRASNSSRTQRAQSASRRSTPASSSPTNGTAGRRLPTPNANASSTSLSATVAKSPRAPAPDLPPRFRAIPHLPNMVNVEPAPPPVMYWSKAPVWGTLPTHGFRAHTVTLVDNVAWIFGGCDEKGCFKDMWCFNIGACARHPSPLPVVSDRMG
jgi:Rab9 effector protein with kelch motifs